MTRTSRLLLLALTAGALVAAFLVLRPDDDPDPPAQAAVEQASSKGADHEGHAGGHAPSSSAGAEELPPPASPSEVPVIRVRDGAPVGGITVLRATSGDPVRFAVASDLRDDVHVHGYDLLDAAGPGERAQLAFRARLEGVFEVELERSGVQIARLVVEPR
jgi:hypothetical protein